MFLLVSLWFNQPTIIITPSIKSSTSVATVDIEPRRLIFSSPGKYFLDVTLPVEINVVGGSCRARFWKKKRVLVVDMEVGKNSVGTV